MEGLIKISDFMDHLQQHNLVIVSKSEFVATTESDLQIMRSNLLKQKTVSIAEIVNGKLLPMKTKQGVRHWISNGTIKETEIIKEKNGKIKILTSAIKRLGYV